MFLLNRTTTMTDFRIASIVPGGDPGPIEVRVIRKWKRSNDLYYFMIDKYVCTSFTYITYSLSSI
ncbi:hypothetical protein Hanom_Chr10g00900211 [Helianthus anomalus]